MDGAPKVIWGLPGEKKWDLLKRRNTCMACHMAKPRWCTVVLADVLKPCPIRHGHYLTASLPWILTTLWTTKGDTPCAKVPLAFWATHVLWCVLVPCMALSVVLTSVWTRRTLYMAMVRWGMVFVALFLMREWFVVSALTSALTHGFGVAMVDVVCLRHRVMRPCPDCHSPAWLVRLHK
jgi:hypothetical protein